MPKVLGKSWNINLTVVLVVIEALDIVIGKRLEEMKISGRVERIQMIALLKTKLRKGRVLAS